MAVSRLIALLTSAILGLTTCAPSESQSSQHPGSQKAQNEDVHASSALAPFSQKRAMRDVRKLAGDIGVRVRTTRGERRAALFVKRRFERLGYETKVQKFGVDGGTSRNVVAWWPSAREYGVVVGGHMDTVPRSPGANDNASGVAVVLELARLFAGRDQVRFVRWVAFGSEEFGKDGRHHVGSQVYVNRLSPKGRRQLAGMVSVDMVADGKPLIVGTAGIGPEVASRTLYRKIRKARIGVEYRTTCDCSDNGPFERAGIPAAFMWSGDEPNYHSPSDKPKNLLPRHLTRTGWAVRTFVRGFDRALMRRLRAH